MCVLSQWRRNGGELVSRMPQPGQAAPAFELDEARQGRLSLEELRGHWIALFFFPKSSSPG
jgi:peroxiredoxin Q/BCP